MARPRFFRADPKMQEAILNAAAKELTAHGYTGASLNQIIEDAGVSKGVFYYYFDDKADLAATVVEHALAGVLQSLKTLELPSGRFDFWKLLGQLARESLSTIRSSPERADLVLRVGTAMVHHPELAARAAPIYREVNEATARLWRRGQEVGAVRRDIPLGALVACLQGLKETMVRVLLPEDRLPSAAEIDRFVSVQLDFFQRLAGAPKKRRAKR
jgi:AcrR family transcriptional regulator